MSPGRRSSCLMSDSTSEEIVLYCKVGGKSSEFLSCTAGFLTLCRVKIVLYLTTLVGHSLHGVADGNTNCAHGTVTSRDDITSFGKF